MSKAKISKPKKLSEAEKIEVIDNCLAKSKDKGMSSFMTFTDFHDNVLSSYIEMRSDIEDLEGMVARLNYLTGKLADVELAKDSILRNDDNEDAGDLYLVHPDIEMKFETGSNGMGELGFSEIEFDFDGNELQDREILKDMLEAMEKRLKIIIYDLRMIIHNSILTLDSWGQ